MDLKIIIVLNTVIITDICKSKFIDEIHIFRNMGNQLAPLGVDYQNANAVGDVLNLPYFYGSISNDILDGAIFNRIFFPGGNIKKRRSMGRSFPKEELPIVPPWGQRRLKRSTQTNADINRSQQEDEIMRGKIWLL